MKFKKILMLGYQEADLPKSEWERVDKLTQEKVFVPKPTPAINKHFSTTDALLVKLGASVDRVMIDNIPNLKYIGILGSGFGRIDASYAAEKNIAVCNIAGYSTEGVAEFAFGIIIEYIRELERAKLQVRKGDYSEASFAGSEIKNKNFGIIGLGRIGGRIAEIALNGFGANMAYWSKNRKRHYEKKGIQYKTVENLLESSDFISVNLALNKETEHFLNKRRIKHIKPGAIVINLAPMELINIPALENRLKKKDMTFMLDHSDELSEEEAERLARYNNCIMYPPVGYVTREATRAKLSALVDNLKNFLKGKPTN